MLTAREFFHGLPARTDEDGTTLKKVGQKHIKFYGGFPSQELVMY